MGYCTCNKLKDIFNIYINGFVYINKFRTISIAARHTVVTVTVRFLNDQFSLGQCDNCSFKKIRLTPRTYLIPNFCAAFWENLSANWFGLSANRPVTARTPKCSDASTVQTETFCVL